MFGVKILRYILKIFSVILIVAFVVLNRQETELYISPLTDPLILPLWLMGLLIFAIGFTVGALLLWLNSWPIRRELSRTKKKLEVHEKEKAKIENEKMNEDILALES